MTRAITESELALLRADGQFSKVYLAIHQPTAIFTARLDTAPTSNDRVAQIAYTSGSGAGALAGHTVCVGTSAGAYDKGQVRLRTMPSLAASGVLNIGETSDIIWESGDYLTILPEFGLWARQVRLVDSTAYVDYDIAYSDQHVNTAPVPVMGAPAVAWMSGSAASVQFDGGDSWALGGGSVSYAWGAPGSASISGSASATPTIVYTSAGQYMVSLTVTSGGVSSTGYRPVFVFSDAAPPITQFQFTDTASSDEGWPFQLKLFAEAALSSVRDRALCVLFTRDYNGGEWLSIGPQLGRENILAWGWIAGESLEWSAELSSVTFDVRPPGYWLGLIPAYPTGQEYGQSAPGAWTQFQNMTVDKCLWHMLYWRSTLTNCADWSLSGDTRKLAELSAPVSTLWEQVTIMASQTILAKPKVDRLGRLWVQIDPQYIEDRSAVPNVLTLTPADWTGTLEATRAPTNSVSTLDLSGVEFDGSNGYAWFSLARGRVFGRHGRTERLERLVLNGQDNANLLAGLVMGQRNNAWPNFRAQLASGNRFLDHAPAQFVTLDIPSGATPRQVGFSGRALVRRVRIVYDAQTGALLTDIEMEGETLAESSVTGDGPTTPPEPPVTDPPVPPAAVSGWAIMTASNYIPNPTYSWNSLRPEWLTAAGTGATDACVDPFDETQNTIWYTSGAAVIKITDFKTTPVYTTVLDKAGGGGFWYMERVVATIAAEGVLWVLGYNSYAVGGGTQIDQYIWRTDDGGATWQELKTCENVKERNRAFGAGQHDPWVCYFSFQQGGSGSPVVLSTYTETGLTYGTTTMIDGGLYGGSIKWETLPELGPAYEFQTLPMPGGETKYTRFVYQCSVPVTSVTAEFYPLFDGMPLTDYPCASAEFEPLIYTYNAPVHNETYGANNFAIGYQTEFSGRWWRNCGIGSIRGVGWTITHINGGAVGVSAICKTKQTAGVLDFESISTGYANDIECYYEGNPDDEGVVLWENTGKLWQWGGTGTSWLNILTAAPSSDAKRIICHTQDSQTIYVLKPNNGAMDIAYTRDRGGTWSTSYTGLSGGCCIGLWPFGSTLPQYQALYVGDTTRVLFSNNGGATLVDKTGNLTLSAGPTCIVPLWLS